MRFHLFLSFICVITLASCSSTGEKFRDSFDPKYKVVDQGGLDAVVKGRACSMNSRDAIAGAKRSAEYHLRSVIGNQRYRPVFKEVRRYNEDEKICVEMSVSAEKP